jgi:hypothetical protein
VLLGCGRAQARKWYDRAARWMNARQPSQPEHQRLHAEAAALLKSKDAPLPARKD